MKMSFFAFLLLIGINSYAIECVYVTVALGNGDNKLQGPIVTGTTSPKTAAATIVTKDIIDNCPSAVRHRDRVLWLESSTDTDVDSTTTLNRQEVSGYPCTFAPILLSVDGKSAQIVECKKLK